MFTPVKRNYRHIFKIIASEKTLIPATLYRMVYSYQISRDAIARERGQPHTPLKTNHFLF